MSTKTVGVAVERGANMAADERTGMKVRAVLTFTAPDGATQEITFALRDADYGWLIERHFDERDLVDRDRVLSSTFTDEFAIALKGTMTAIDPIGSTLYIETTEAPK